jgi:serralysin
METESRPSGDIPSYEEFRESVRTIIRGREVFVLEGDMLMSTDAQLRAYYEETYLRPSQKSIVNGKIVGLDPLPVTGWDLRLNPEAIRYCFAAGWGQWMGVYTAPPIEPTRSTIQAGMRAWEGVANVRFVYRSDLDGNACSTSSGNPGVDFVVQHYQSPNTAKGPFPSNDWEDQDLLVPTSGITNSALAMHELGHVLGFRHEHTHSGASPRCEESGPYFQLTGFDTLSIMKYADCTSSQNIGNSSLSELDGIGARVVYGPPEWWWAMIK